MAFQKKEKVEKEVAEVVESTVNSVKEVAQEVTSAPEVKTSLPEVKVADEKVVKIKPNFSGKKFVGNIWFNFVKGEVTTVPKNVKDILTEQNALDFL